MIDIDKVAFAMEKFLTSEIGCGITWFMSWLIVDVVYYVIVLFALFKVIKPLVNVICEKIKNKK